MQSNDVNHPVVASHRELDAKLELLQQLGYGDRFFLDDDHEHASIPEKQAYHDRDTNRWIQTEYNWAMEEAAESAAPVPDLFDLEDEEACLPYVYDPWLFAGRQSLPPSPRSRSQSLSQNVDKPLPTLPPLRLRNRPSFPIVPPPSPARGSSFASSLSTPPSSPCSLRSSPPPSPQLSISSRPRTFPRSQDPSYSPSSSPSAFRHATYPSISSTLSLLEECETEAEKRSAVYIAEVDQELPRPILKSPGRGRSSSAVVMQSGEFHGSFPVSSSPRRRQRPALAALATSASSPQLRELAELATTPSPSFSVGSSTLPSPAMSDVTMTPDTEVVSPGEAITYSPVESPGEVAEDPGLASRWSLDSVAARPRIIRMALDDALSSPANKTRKRDRLLSLISGRARAGSVTKPLPPPNTPRGSSDVLDIRYAQDSPTTTFSSSPSVIMAPSLSSNSSNASSASTLSTPVESTHPSPILGFSEPHSTDTSTCRPQELEEQGPPIFAANPYLIPESPLLEPEQPATPPPHEPLTLQIPERPLSPGLPLQPTLPLPSPSTPSPSFFVPSPRPQSFFASITGRQRRRRKKLVVSGVPLELAHNFCSSSVTASQLSVDDIRRRQIERQRRVDNVTKWCESFGPLRKIETKDDGSLHVYWKEWEVADMVCRVQAQVVIKDVGRVNLAWQYIS